MSEPSQKPDSSASRERAKGRDLGRLSHLWPFVRPYRWQVLGAICAATIAASTVLALGRGIAALIDQGFGRSNAELLDHALAAIIGGTIVLASATYVRVSVVSWLGERVVADIRRAVYDHVAQMIAAGLVDAEAAGSGELGQARQQWPYLPLSFRQLRHQLLLGPHLVGEHAEPVHQSD